MFTETNYLLAEWSELEINFRLISSNEKTSLTRTSRVRHIVDDDDDNEEFENKKGHDKRRRLGSLQGNICQMKITVDNQLYHLWNRNEDDIAFNVNFMLNVVNDIYRQQIFIKTSDNQKLPLQFSLKTLQTETDSFCFKNEKLCRDRRIAAANGKAAFLKHFSDAESHQDYCLSFVLTGHRFGTTIGRAFVGGLCDVYGYNGGFIVVKGNETSWIEAAEVFAHELGHSLGSNHDGINCPSDHLMAPFVTYAETSKTFSNCSIEQINNMEKTCLVHQDTVIKRRIWSFLDSPQKN